MKLAEALRIQNSLASPEALARPSFDVHLACGFTPLHLRTFLTAHLQLLLPGKRVFIHTGTYGQCLDSVRSVRPPLDAVMIPLEWPDFDPRLGLRRLGGWRPRDLPDIVATVRAQADGFEQAIVRAAELAPLAVSLPSLPLVPASYFPGGMASELDAGVLACTHQLASRLAANHRIKIIHPHRLDQVSPPAQRRDVQVELTADFPYRLPHAAALAELLAGAVAPRPSKKGLITDLDDTLWRGILGDVGAAGISWDLDHHSHAHGIYQQLLEALADTGVLLAVASKNEPQNVAEAFSRSQLNELKSSFYPMDVSWGPKSEAVARIVRAWNIGADSVVFIDDSPMELAEVKAAHPDVECVLFPTNDAQAVVGLLERLRDLFGKTTIAAEDTIRGESLRQAGLFAEAVQSTTPETFLKQIEGEITFAFVGVPALAGAEPAKAGTPTQRALELVNKTNQFNLNGRRWTEAAWNARGRNGDFLLQASYKDKYGPLGIISVLAGHIDNGTAFVDTWVLSCRAFSRRIEHHVLHELFGTLEIREIAFDFQATAKNGPTRQFFAELVGAEPTGPVRISRSAFVEKCPVLPHQTTRSIHG